MQNCCQIAQPGPAAEDPEALLLGQNTSTSFGREFGSRLVLQEYQPNTVSLPCLRLDSMSQQGTENERLEDQLISQASLFLKLNQRHRFLG